MDPIQPDTETLALAGQLADLKKAEDAIPEAPATPPELSDQFTPGPWTIGPSTSSTSYIMAPRRLLDTDRPPSGSPETLDSLAGCFGAPDVRKANVRALVAVPDLVKALRAARSALLGYQHGNASPDLAEEVARHCTAVLAKITPPQP